MTGKTGKTPTFRSTATTSVSVGSLSWTFTKDSLCNSVQAY